jgi:hypothetical protein
MAKQVIYRRGTTAEHALFTGANGEVTVDTVKHVVIVHDGVTAGGIPQANAALVNSQIATLTANAANQATAITVLQANAGVQANTLATLTANAATQQASINAFILASNATALFANIASINANVAAANVQIGLLVGNATVQSEDIAEIKNGVATFGNIVPSANVTYDLGSSTYRWRDLYLSGNTINLGGTVLSADGYGGLSVPGGIASAGGAIVGFTAGIASDGQQYLQVTVSADQQTVTFDPAWDPGYTLDPVFAGPQHNAYNTTDNVGTDAVFSYDKTGTAINSITLVSGGSGYPDLVDTGIWYFVPDPAEEITITGVVDPLDFPNNGYLGEFTSLTLSDYQNPHTATITIDGDVWSITYRLAQQGRGGYSYVAAETTVTCNGSAVVDPVKLSKLANGSGMNGLYVHRGNFTVLRLDGSAGVGDQAILIMFTFNKQWPSEATVALAIDAPDNGTQGSTNIIGAATISGNTTTSNLAVSGTITFGDDTIQTTANIMLAAFTMANYQHWTSNVTTIGNALNQLATRLTAAGF